LSHFRQNATAARSPLRFKQSEQRGQLDCCIEIVGLEGVVSADGFLGHVGRVVAGGDRAVAGREVDRGGESRVAVRLVLIRVVESSVTPP